MAQIFTSKNKSAKFAQSARDYSVYILIEPILKLSYESQGGFFKAILNKFQVILILADFADKADFLLK